MKDQETWEGCSDACDGCTPDTPIAEQERRRFLGKVGGAGLALLLAPVALSQRAFGSSLRDGQVGRIARDMASRAGEVGILTWCPDSHCGDVHCHNEYDCGLLFIGHCDPTYCTGGHCTEEYCDSNYEGCPVPYCSGGYCVTTHKC